MALRIMFVDMQISIHTPHAGSDFRCAQCHPAAFLISIHTPHAGSDQTSVGASAYGLISIHTPHAGSDRMTEITDFSYQVFQSTLPMRGATGQ